MKETFKEFCARILPIVKAGADGKEIEYFSILTDTWVAKDIAGIDSVHKYRIAKPKQTPLPITPEMWEMIDPRHKFACMNASGAILFSTTEPEWRWSRWHLVVLKSTVSFQCESPLAIDTTGIIPELSLTKRPDVLINKMKSARDGLMDEAKAVIKEFNETGKRCKSNPSVNMTYTPLESDKAYIKSIAKDDDEFSDNVISEKIVRHVAEGEGGTDYLVIEHRNPMTGVTQTMRFKIK